MAEAWLTVDSRCALLHKLLATDADARWLLHTAIVERLATSRCDVLLTYSLDAPAMLPGQQYFQRLLGYTVVRLRPHAPSLAESRSCVWVDVVAMAAIVAIVVQQVLSNPTHLPGLRALIWLTALAAVRVATCRTGWASLVGGVAALATVVVGAAPEVSIAYFLGGVALDAELALFPKLGETAIAMSVTGATVIFVALIAPEFPTLGHHRHGASWLLPPVVGGLVFGALAAMLGWRIGRAFELRNAARAASARRAPPSVASPPAARDQALVSGLSVSQVWWLAVLVSSFVSATDALLPGAVLIAAVSAGPLCGILTGRWRRTATAALWALALALALGPADGIWGTRAQLAYLGAVALTSLLSIWSTAFIERRRHQRLGAPAGARSGDQ